MIAELDSVVLTRNVPEHSLAVGDVGVVVHRHEGGYEVEFVTGGGETVALLTLGGNDLRPIGRAEILHAATAIPPHRRHRGQARVTAN